MNINDTVGKSEGDVRTLLHNNGQSKTLPINRQGTCKDEGKDELLSMLVLNFIKDGEVSTVLKQFAEIINKRWASKLVTTT